MASTRDVYENFKPLLEAQQDATAVDTKLIAERTFITQVANGSAGASAGGPSDGATEPLIKKQRRFPEDDACTEYEF